MVRAGELAVGSVAAVAFFVHYACAAKLPQSTSARKNDALQPELSTSYGSQDSWNKGIPSLQIYPQIQHDWDISTDEETNGTLQVTTSTYEKGTKVSKVAGWQIAIMVIVPPLTIFVIISLCVCVCTALCKRTVHSPTYVHQEGPPP